MSALMHATPASGAATAIPSRRQPSSPASAIVDLVHAAKRGDRDAWAELVRAFEPGLRSIARSYRLSASDVDDVLQTTWLNLFESLARIREPGALGGWLATATRRAALRRLQRAVREDLTADADSCVDHATAERSVADDPEACVLAKERAEVLAGALNALPHSQRALLSLLLDQPGMPYDEISERLSMPRGSIGPTRSRALTRLEQDTALRAISWPGDATARN